MHRAVGRFLAHSVVLVALGLFVPSWVAFDALADPTAAPAEQVALDPAEPDVRTIVAYQRGSSVVQQRYRSTVLDRELHYRLFLPPGYAGETRRYPVVYLLHGVAGGSSEWQELGLLDAADRLMAAGEIEPMLIALPDAGPNYWVNHASGARWGDTVVEDLVPSVDSRYRTIPTREARAIGGLSMGGEGALRLAFLHPDTFGTAAAHAPSLRIAFAQLSEELQVLYGDADAWRAVSPYWLSLDTDAAARVAISLDIGEDDPWRANLEAMHRRLDSLGIEHDFVVLDGEHDPTYWEANVERYLRFYSRVFAQTATEDDSL